MHERLCAQANRQGNNATSERSRRRAKRATLVMLGLTLVIATTLGPVALLYLFENNVPTLSNGAARIVVYWGYANSAVNPIIYALTCPKLRRAALCGGNRVASTSR